ncbi:hypothetical protein PsorP6_008006 [Peronosclerospora sorghi]|uniref:Uncharacterized protein n=1 Tax=Peronosclerospora sorghi TaxID=230839 RepID=A0ACC0WAG4_9STRA|nr:hypothetical protein PsorP6_008006 [Peronosclerospora sorghi]
MEHCLNIFRLEVLVPIQRHEHAHDRTCNLHLLPHVSVSLSLLATRVTDTQELSSGLHAIGLCRSHGVEAVEATSAPPTTRMPAFTRTGAMYPTIQIPFVSFTSMRAAIVKVTALMLSEGVKETVSVSVSIKTWDTKLRKGQNLGRCAGE